MNLKQISWKMDIDNTTDNIIAPYYDDRYESPCNNFKAKEFLEKTYMLEGFRKEYFEKEIESLCARQAFGEFFEPGDRDSKDLVIYANNLP